MIRIVCLLLLFAGIAWNVRFAIAELAARRNQPRPTRLAMRLIPENPAYAAQLAEEIYATDPAQAEQLLERAVRQNRYDAPRWIELALLLEEANKLPQAETALLEAAKVDATYLPNWSLANFYFRHGQPDLFWASAKNAARLAPDDAAPLFRLAWYTSPDAVEVERQLNLGRGPRGEQFVSFLMGQGDPVAVAQAARRLLETSSPILPGVCDWLIAQRRADLALPLWSSLASRGQVPAAGTGEVTNGDFGRSPLSHGFDWRLPPVDGVSSYLNSNPNALGFEFSGNEPDNFVLMSQTVVVQSGKSYTLAAAYRTQGVAAGSGITWQVQDVQSGAVLARSGSLAAEQGGTSAACFSAPKGASSVNLLLTYQRQPGTVRVEGKISLDAVRLTAGPCPG
jgi:tetratricopeptide (TPR) repeat protein